MGDPRDFDPFAPAVIQCPYPHYARLRDEAPVVWNDRLNAFIVTRHDLIVEALKQPQIFSSRYGRASMPVPPEDQARLEEVYAEGWPRVPTLLTQDRPEHTRYRRLVSSAFTPRRVAEHEARMRELCNELIDAWADQEVIDLVEAFSIPYPIAVIAPILSVPDNMLSEFFRWSNASAGSIGTSITIDQRLAMERVTNEAFRFFAGQIELRREEPRNDFLSDLVAARIDDTDDTNDTGDVEDKRPLDLTEILSILNQLIVAGNETSRNTITETVLWCARRPEQWQRVREDPAYIPVLVEEVLRLATPSQSNWRLATVDTELGGVAIPAGSRLALNNSAANHDPSVFGADPDDLCPGRENIAEHLAFGKGVHFCLGAALARFEIRVAIEELAKRVESFRLAEGFEEEYLASFMLRGLLSLDVHPVLTVRS